MNFTKSFEARFDTLKLKIERNPVQKVGYDYQLHSQEFLKRYLMTWVIGKIYNFDFFQKFNFAFLDLVWSVTSSFIV